jgi:hypothetical protein
VAGCKEHHRHSLFWTSFILQHIKCSLLRSDTLVAESEINRLDEKQVQLELAQLAKTLHEANTAYHTNDAPEITDAEFDQLKRRNSELEK